MKRTFNRDGFTLLEVLIATSVIMVGIFGIASAIGLCEQLFKTSFRADMAADCGRAALETMLAQNWMEELGDNTLCTYNWHPAGTCKDADKLLASTATYDEKIRSSDFGCVDHLRQNNAGIDLEQNPPNYDLTLKSDYAWVGTIQKIGSEYCEVSAAVAHKPDRTDARCGSIAFTATNISDDLGVVRVQVSGNNDNQERLVVGQYVFLWSNSGGHWYRIGSFYDGQMELYGPQWTYAANGNIYTPGGVVAAYSQIVPIQNR